MNVCKSERLQRKSKPAEGWQNNLYEEVQAEVANQRKLYAIVEQRMKRGRWVALLFLTKAWYVAQQHLMFGQL